MPLTERKVEKLVVLACPSCKCTVLERRTFSRVAKSNEVTTYKLVNIFPPDHHSVTLCICTKCGHPVLPPDTDKATLATADQGFLSILKELYPELDLLTRVAGQIDLEPPSQQKIFVGRRSAGGKKR